MSGTGPARSFIYSVKYVLGLEVFCGRPGARAPFAPTKFGPGSSLSETYRQVRSNELGPPRSR